MIHRYFNIMKLNRGCFCILFYGPGSGNACQVPGLKIEQRIQS